LNHILTWGSLSALLIAISGFCYMRGIYRREVPRPVLSSWGIWAVLGGFVLKTYYDTGARMDTTLPAAWLGFINPIIILCLGRRYGQWKWSKLDTYCVVAFIVAVLVWKTSDSAVIGLTGGIMVDAIGCIPQARHCITHPEDEPWFPWTMFFVGSAVNLFAVEKWEFGYYLFPVYMTTFSSLFVIPILMYRLRTRFVRAR
jgi:hypothetical protein